MKKLNWKYLLVGTLLLVVGIVAAGWINRKLELKEIEKLVSGDAIIEQGQTASGQSMSSLKAV